MSKRLAAMATPGTGQSGALLPPPPTAAGLEPRPLSGPLHEGSSPAEAPSPEGSEKCADEGAEQQESSHNSAAARSAQQHEQQQQQVLPSSVRREGTPDDRGEEEDDQFGSFIVA